MIKMTNAADRIARMVFVLFLMVFVLFLSAMFYVRSKARSRAKRGKCRFGKPLRHLRAFGSLRALLQTKLIVLLAAWRLLIEEKFCHSLCDRRVLNNLRLIDWAD